MDIPFEAYDFELVNDDMQDTVKDAPNISINYTPGLKGTPFDTIIYITRSGAFINFSDIAIKSKKDTKEYILELNKIINKIENYFTLTIVNVITGKTIKRRTCIVDKNRNRIIVPRFGIFEIADAKYGLQNIKVVSQIPAGLSPDKLDSSESDKLGSKIMLEQIKPPDKLDSSESDKLGSKIMLEQIKPPDKLDSSESDKLGSKIMLLDSPSPSAFTWHGKLTHNQQIISEYMLKNIYNDDRVACGSASCILNLEAGQGKSYLAAYLISVFKKKTAIILHSTSMIEQWKKVLNACFPGVKVGCYYHKEKTHGDIMIFIINSATKDKIVIEGKELLAGDFHERFGFAIYDECHLYNNSFLGKAFKYLQTQKMIGLSATPDESKTDKLVWWELGPVLTANKLPGFQVESVNFKANIYKIKYAGPPDFTQVIKNEFYDITNTPLTINMICEDYDRNKVIVDCIIEYMQENRFLYVFSQRREHLTVLMKMLKAEIQRGNTTRLNDGFEHNNTRLSSDHFDIISDVVCDDDDFVRLVGGSKAIDAENAEIKANVIFTTYQYGATGRSIIKMTGAVLASPVSSKMKQIIGRILRLGSDAKIVRKIYDIVDTRLKLKSYWSKRKKYYDEMKFKIIEYKNIKIDTPTVANSPTFATAKEAKTVAKTPSKMTTPDITQDINMTLNPPKNLDGVSPQKISSIYESILARTKNT